MLVFEFSNLLVLSFWIFLVIALNFWGVLKKKSFLNLISLIVSITLLIIHIRYREFLEVSINQNVITDFVFLIVSISTYLYVDDIETRRKVISEVFENKYKKEEKKWKH